MKPAPFDYVAAHDVDDAVRALATTSGARVLAGGQALVPLMAQRLVRPALLVDVGGIPGFADVRLADGTLRIGAGATLRSLESHPLVRARAPVLAEAAALVGPVHVRNRATLGGSLAHADPAAEVPAALLATAATVHVAGPGGGRACPVDGLVTGRHRTALGDAELVVAVDVPARAGRTGGAFREFATRVGDLPLVGVACAVRLDDDGRCAEATAVACGVDDRPRVLTTVGRLVAGRRTVDASLLREVASTVGAELEPPSDARASGDYRRELAQGLAVEALSAAWRSAGMS